MRDIKTGTAADFDSTHLSSTSGAYRRSTAGERVAKALRNAIFRGDLEPGGRLRQIELASRLGVSTTPVREALALLQAEGLVRVDPHRGAIVAHQSIEDLMESFLIRSELEPMAVSAAVPLLTRRDTDHLQALIDHMRELEHEAEWLELNDRWHMTLYRYSRMTRLCTIIETLRESTSVYFHRYVAYRIPNRHSDDRHEDILNACRLRDVRKVKSLVRAPIKRSIADLQRAAREGKLPSRAWTDPQRTPNRHPSVTL